MATTALEALPPSDLVFFVPVLLESLRTETSEEPKLWNLLVQRSKESDELWNDLHAQLLNRRADYRFFRLFASFLNQTQSKVPASYDRSHCFVDILMQACAKFDTNPALAKEKLNALNGSAMMEAGPVFLPVLPDAAVVKVEVERLRATENSANAMLYVPLKKTVKKRSAHSGHSHGSNLSATDCAVRS
jgi:hypothetical protein